MENLFWSLTKMKNQVVMNNKKMSNFGKLNDEAAVTLENVSSIGWPINEILHFCIVSESVQTNKVLTRSPKKLFLIMTYTNFARLWFPNTQKRFWKILKLW